VGGDSGVIRADDPDRGGGGDMSATNKALRRIC
jgi:hypothetical protein